ncbi:hypothetical protein [Plantibacter sp. YIM 135347]|uniref:hypothetical protein n=1 Tax=Plantibacter sp. YIM 135347 TaxID=3423919 RepID=UPI003D344ECB
MNAQKVDADEVPLRTTRDTPASIPKLTVNGVSPEPVAYDWVVDGSWTQHRDTDDENDLILVAVPPPFAARTEVHLQTTAMPSQLYITRHVELDESGLPTGIGTEVNCLTAEDPCMAENGGSGISYSLPATANETVLIVHLGYWGDPPTDQETSSPRLYSAAWAVRESSRAVE